ncbi:hypothetical protein [Helicobacter pylori]|jgi:hypothetical protein|uniref:Dihydrolipoamide acetyltransferase n=2 Tax=Helicobacter pylori TaxID=210 RepID=O24900_HELPY|nr:hypothetical protein [Helicobacter pylori]AAD07137.1 predicted coding region HP0060 [Helicobacter pylori 26695]AFV41278.1 hypothetical protein C694_00285 [Helicobacter pylori 26695]AFV42872.1 hypothetical protein C695_00285 [Helicobacter pylori Rif1]AFV44467.1 hypothetical protein C730_00285 [Helicobacter pylori Rif2]AJF08379.1 hypothetical protein SE87_00320 [Helicobacter pylori 26695-1]
MVTPLKSLKLPIGHPLVEILCELSLNNKAVFNEEAPINFKKEVSEEEKIKFKQALRVLHAIVNNEASLRYLSDDNQKFMEGLAQADKITNEQIEKTLEIVSYSDVDVDFEAFKEMMLKVDNIAVGLKSYSQSQLLDLNGGHWDLDVPSLSKESVTFRFDNLPKEEIGGEEIEKNFYARSSLKDVNKQGVVAIDFGTKSTTAAYMDNNGKYRLLSIGGDVDIESLQKYENPTIVEFRYKEKFLKDYNALSHRPFTEKNDIQVAHEAQKELSSAQGNHFYRFFSQLKQWAGADEKRNFRDLIEDFSLESFTNCTDFNPIEIYAYCIGRCINNMENGVFLKYFLSYPIKYEKHQAEKIRESFEKGLKKSLPRHVFDDEKTAKMFKVELKASEPCAYAISALKSYGFDKFAKLDKPIYYGVFDFGGGTTDFDFGKWEKSANPKFAYKMTHFSNGGDKYLGGENLLELLAWEMYAQNFQELKAKDVVIAKPNYDRIDTQRFGSFMQNSREARLNLQTIASNLRPFLEKLDANIIEAIEENEEFEIEGFEKEFKVQLLDRNGGDSPVEDFKVDYKELLNLLKDKIDDGVKNFFAGFSKVMAENIDNQCRAFHIFLGGNASKSVLVKQAFENAKEEQLKAYKQKTSKDDFTFILYEPLGTEASDKQILELTGEDVSNKPAYLKPTCKTGVAFGLLESRPKAGGIERPSIDFNPVFKYDLGIEREGKFHTRISRDSLKPNEYQIFQTKEEWGGFDGLEIRYSDKSLANTNTLDIEDTQLIFIALEEHEEVDVKVCSIDSQSIKVGLFKDNQLIYESEAEKL